MRPGVTPVPIPNTMVKTRAADGTMLETAWESRWLPGTWGISSVGRAPALQAGGHEFDSRILHSHVRREEAIPAARARNHITSAGKPKKRAYSSAG